MTEITQIGLGLMGSALARALLAGGRRVTAWNRDPAKAAEIVTLGASGAGSIGDAVRASPLIMICIDSYASTLDLFGAEDVAPLLAGKTLIQLSTGMPREARACEAWARARGADYIDGAILAGPPDIGKDAQIVVSGAEAAFARCQPYLKFLAGDLRYVGAEIGAAATLDLAWLAEFYGFFLGAIHAARLCEAENVGVDVFASLFPEGNRSNWFAATIHSGRFENPTATLGVWYAALKRIQTHARDAGINCEVPDFAAGFFKRALAAGYGEEDVAALVKVLRPAA